ncbi:MAG: helix-turn-helix domain-containing protein [Raoultibacter sp.]
MYRPQITLSTSREESELFAGFPDLLTIDDLRSITGLSDQTLRGEMRNGNLPACKIGRRWFSPKSQFIEYVSGASR